MNHIALSAFRLLAAEFVVSDPFYVATKVTPDEVLKAWSIASSFEYAGRAYEDDDGYMTAQLSKRFMKEFGTDMVRRNPDVPIHFVSLVDAFETFLYKALSQIRPALAA